MLLLALLFSIRDIKGFDGEEEGERWEAKVVDVEELFADPLEDDEDDEDEELDVVEEEDPEVDEKELHELSDGTSGE